MAKDSKVISKPDYNSVSKTSSSINNSAEMATGNHPTTPKPPVKKK